MKIQTLIAVSFLALLSSIFGQTSPLPKIVTEGFDVYKKDGAAKAFDAWLIGSPLEKDTTTKINIIGGITQIEAAYGKFSGYEYLGQVPFTSSVTRYYVVGLYEKGPLYMWFEVYTKDGKEILPSFDCNTKANLILPSILYPESPKK